MKHASDKTNFLHSPRALAVDVESDRGILTLTIKIPVRGVTQRSMLRHPARLKENVEDLVEGVLASPRPSASVKRLAAQVNGQQSADVAAARTKLAQATIGVTSTVHMRQVIVDEAGDREVEPSVVARDLFERGLSRLEERVWEESSKEVLADFARAYGHFTSDETKQWSLRIPRRVYIRAQLAGKEYGLSMSQLACWCVAVGLELEVAA